ncbi:MAG: rhodanese-like domain-containing protein [Pseudomonadota bacterium]
MAVAIKALGFTNIKIYNGGLKDWQKSGYPIDSIQPLGDHQGRFISPDELWAKLQDAEAESCQDANGNSLVTIVDYRTENFMEDTQIPVAIKTRCPTVRMLLDDFMIPVEREKIPRKGLVVVVSETGNRDWAAMSYLARFGYTNVIGLENGMRGWIKADLPVGTSR